jgi:hypothetical protein
MRQFTRFALIPVIFGLLALVPHSIARADTVLHFTVPYVFSVVDNSCGFPIIVSGTGELKFNVHLDNQGNFVAFERVGAGGAVTTFTNPANGFSVDAPTSPFQDRINPNGQEFVTGAITRLTVPGVGALAMVTGRWLVDPSTGQLIQLSGQATTDPNQSIFAIPAVCAVFANPPTH